MRILTIILRGIAQVFFQRSVVAGAFILLGLFLASPRLGALALLGAVVQSAAAWVMGLKEEAREGLMGYNGALVGVAASLPYAYLNDGAVAFAMTTVGALACIPIHLCLARLFRTSALLRFDLPVLTAPFCAVAGLMFGALGGIVVPEELEHSSEWGRGSLMAIFDNFSEVMLADSVVCGALILLGLVAASRQAAIFGLLGSLVAVGFAVALHHDVTVASSGLLGYSGVLVAIAIGAVFWVERPIWQRVLGAVVGGLIAQLLQMGIEFSPFKYYTWPFIITTWLLLVVGPLVLPGNRKAVPQDWTAVDAQRAPQRADVGPA